MIYDGVLYFNNSPVIIPSTETVVTKNVKKKSKKIGAKLFDINTSDYKKLTSNKRVEIIQLFDKLRPNHPQLQAKRFWKALLKGGIQGALYINDSTKVL